MKAGPTTAHERVLSLASLPQKEGSHSSYLSRTSLRFSLGFLLYCLTTLSVHIASLPCTLASGLKLRDMPIHISASAFLCFLAVFGSSGLAPLDLYSRRLTAMHRRPIASATSPSRRSCTTTASGGSAPASRRCWRPLAARPWPT